MGNGGLRDLVKRPERVRRFGGRASNQRMDGRSSPQLSIKDIHKIDRHARQALFPTDDTDSPVKLVDRRRTDKKAYLSKLLEREESVVFYVRDEKAADQFIHLIGSSADTMGRCDDGTPESEIEDLTDALESGKLRAIVSTRALMAASQGAKHLVFCHPVPTPLIFFNIGVNRRSERRRRPIST